MRFGTICRRDLPLVWLTFGQRSLAIYGVRPILLYSETPTTRRRKAAKLVANSTRENLIQAGLDLFHRHGIHLVGLDRILQKAGVTKTTFYNHFESKENFACAVIDRFGEEIHARIRRRFDAPRAEEIKQHLLGIFDVWDQLSSGKSFRGCLLVGAGVASGDRNDPARQAAIRNKRMLLEAYRDLASNAGIKNAKRFATRFGLLVDGALVARHLYDDHTEAEEARKMAEKMIDEELAKPRKPHV